jgi:hypothetical protein
MQIKEKNEKKIVLPEDSHEFYNSSEAITGCSAYWLHDVLTIEEWAAVSLNKNPKVVSFKNMQRYKGCKYQFVEQYFAYIEICKRHFTPSLKHQNYHPYHSPTQITHVQIEITDFIELFDTLEIKIHTDWLSKLEAKKQRKLTTENLKFENESLKKQLNQINMEIEGISLTEIRNADCLTPKMQYLLLAAHKFWVGLKDKPEKQHPRNQDVIDWLSNKEFDPTTAKRMASFIRPEWAKKGPPKKQ